MISGALRTERWLVETWEAPSRPGLNSADHWLVAPRADGSLRVAVADGVTPTRATPGALGLSGDVYGACLVLAAMRADAPLERCAERANAELHRPGLPGRDQPQATFVAADLDPGGDVRLVRGGDCEAWAEREDGWDALLNGEILEPDVRERLLVERRAEPRAGHDRVAAIERELLREPAGWLTSPPGRFAEPRLEAVAAPELSSLVLATDGARLTAERLEILDDWLRNGLRDWEREHRAASTYRHGDIAVLRITAL